MQIQPTAGQKQSLSNAFLGNCVIVPQQLLNNGKRAGVSWGGGEDEKRWYSLVVLWVVRVYFCGTLGKPWKLAEVRTENQAQGGRICEDLVCREAMDPGFLITELLPMKSVVDQWVGTGWWLTLVDHFPRVLISLWLYNGDREWCFQWHILACRMWWTFASEQTCRFTHGFQTLILFNFFVFQGWGEQWGWDEL